jgi:hypothetical protein
VIVFEANEALTPDGSPVAVPIPVAPVVLCVIAVNVVLLQTVGVLDGAPAATTAIVSNQTLKSFTEIEFVPVLAVPDKMKVIVSLSANEIGVKGDEVKSILFVVDVLETEIVSNETIA